MQQLALSKAISHAGNHIEKSIYDTIERITHPRLNIRPVTCNIRQTLVPANTAKFYDLFSSTVRTFPFSSLTKDFVYYSPLAY
jgi:hypothetical protein